MTGNDNAPASPAAGAHAILAGLGLRDIGAENRGWRGHLPAAGGTIEILISPARLGLPHYLAAGVWHVAYLRPGDLTPAEAANLNALARQLKALSADGHRALAGELAAAVNGGAHADPPYPRKRSRLRAIAGVPRQGDALVRLAMACDHHCRFCNNGEHAPDYAIGAAQVSARLRELARQGTGRVAFTGGEPTLIPALPAYVAEAKALGLTPGLQTHAMHLGEGGLAARLASQGLAFALVSLHAANAAVSDAITGVPGAFARTCGGIEAALTAGIAVDLNFVIHRTNLGEVAAFPDFAAARFGGALQVLVFSFAAPVAAAWENQELLPPLADATGPLTAALERARARGLIARVPGYCGVPMCVLPGHLEHFDEFTTREPQPLLPARTYLPDCEACAVRARCSGIWKRYLELHGGTPFLPIPANVLPAHRSAP